MLAIYDVCMCVCRRVKLVFPSLTLLKKIRIFTFFVSFFVVFILDKNHLSCCFTVLRFKRKTGMVRWNPILKVKILNIG